MAGQIRLDEGAAPVTPPANEVAIYVKADGRVYSKDDTGAESPLSSPATTDSLPEGATNLYYTDERAQDAVGNILTDTSTIDFTYDDVGATVSAIVKLLSISDAHIAVAAAIALNKLAATTASRGLVSDANGFVSPSTTTATEIGYVGGVTAPLQAQIDGKQAADADLTALAGLSATGFITRTGAGSATTRTLQPGSGISVTDGDGIGADPVIAVDGLDSTFISDFNEAAQDAVATALTPSTTIAFTYVDALNLIGANVVTGSLTNAEISGSAAIAYAKLALSNSITNADVNATAGIVYSKLNLTGSITNADIAALAGIAYSKLTLTGAIVNGDISASAAIALTKLAAVTANRAIVSDGSGLLTPSTTTAAEIGFVGGVTSAIQTQIDGKQPLDSDLTAIAGLSTTGLIVRTGTGSATTRSVAAGSSKLTVTNGDGVAGNPTVDVSEANLTLNNIGGTLGISKGGTGQTTQTAAYDALSPNTTRGDITTRGATNNVRLAIGAANTVLTTNGTDPSWTSLVNANVSASAAIARSKLASGTANYAVRNDGTGVMSEFPNRFDPRSFFELYDDFTGSVANETAVYGWISTRAGTGSGSDGIATATDPTKHVGVVAFSTGTTTTGRVTHALDRPFLRLGGSTFTWESDVRVPTSSVLAERYKLYAGFGDTNGAGDMANGVYFSYTDTESGGNWQLNTASASTRTATSSATAVTTAWVRLKIEINAAASSATFYIDGTSVGTIATNIPTATETGWLYKIEKSLGTTNRTFEVDYFHSFGVFTAQR